MKSFHFYLDSADLGELRQCLPHPVVHGVTTNPTLLRRASIRSRENFLALLQMGVGAITIPPRLFAELLDRDPAFAAGRAFLYDARA